MCEGMTGVLMVQVPQVCVYVCMYDRCIMQVPQVCVYVCRYDRCAAARGR
jgi:hypothetical protein